MLAGLVHPFIVLVGSCSPTAVLCLAVLPSVSRWLVIFGDRLDWLWLVSAGFTGVTCGLTQKKRYSIVHVARSFKIEVVGKMHISFCFTGV